MQEGAQTPEEGGILAKLLGEDVARAGKRLLHVRHLAADVGRGQRLGRGRPVGEDRLGERGQTPLARDHRPGAAFGLEGEVEVLERGLGVRLR